jgi:polyhydroxyalkanoate synthesis regulator phasin
LEYYDDLRRCYYTAKLSPVWNQSLEELANNQEMTATLKQLLEDVISQIRQNSNLWENNYLLKLQKFVDYVDKLPESSPNYSCKSTVVGARGTIVKQGVINRLIQRIKGEIQNTLPLSVNDNLTARGDLIVNRGDSLERELKQLQKGLDQGNFNQKEYEVKRKEIMDKYGLS